MADSWNFCFNFLPEVLNTLDFTSLPAAGMLNINGGRVQIQVPKVKGQITRETIAQNPQIAHFAFFAAENLKHNTNAQSYLAARGISTDAAIKAGIGWADNALCNDGKFYNGAAAVFLMKKADGELGGIQWRGVLKTESGQPRSADSSLTLGASTITNPWLFESEPVAVCEGAFDAAAIIMRGRRAISLYGVENFKNLFADGVGQIKAPLIIATDSDDAGKKAFSKAPQYASKAQILNEPFFCDGVDFGGVKDLNDLMLESPELFAERADACFSLCEKGESFFIPTSEPSTVENSKTEPEPFDFIPISETSQNFFDEIARNKNLGAIPTFSTPLNNALGGGFKAGRLYVVGAQPALGKTALALQIGNYAAAWAKAQKNGVKVLFFSLELSASELLARSASRLSFEYAAAGKLKKGYSTDAILSGNMPTNELEIIQAEANSAFWGETFIVGGHLGEVTIDAIEKILVEYKRQFEQPPLVIVDYFQIIESGDSIGFKTDKQRADENISRLKGLATRLDLPILLVSALARAKYESEPAIDAFKETGKIEYTADVLIALEIAREKEPAIGGAKGKASKENARKREIEAYFDATKKGQAGKVELKILKQRLGVGRQSVELLFNPLKNTFTDIPTDAAGNLYSFATEPPWTSNNPQIKVF